MSDEDFPAAHSMDTHWFAVDKAGQVARFDTGEAGAVPVSSGTLSVEEILSHFPPNSPIQYEVEDLIATEGGPVFHYSYAEQRSVTASFSDSQSCYSVLMLLKAQPLMLGQDAQPPASASDLLKLVFKPDEVHNRLFAELIASVGPIQPIPNSRHLLGYIEGPLPVGILQQLVQSGLVLKAWVNHGLSAERLGIYEYSHGDGFENWVAGLYLLENVPVQPLRLQDLPPTLRDALARVHFAQRKFGQDAAIDPREAGECVSWGTPWVGFDGIVQRADEDDEGTIA